MTPAKLIVWYNTKCPVCDYGINRQRNKLVEAVKSGAVEFRDINLEPDALARHGASADDVRRRLHATDDQDRLIVGADVAIEIWRRTPGESWIAALLGAPGVINLARFAYDRFADLLFAWNKRNGRW